MTLQKLVLRLTLSSAKHISTMSLNENLVNEAKVVAASISRTATEQIEFWSEVGKRVTADLTHAQTLLHITSHLHGRRPVSVVTLARQFCTGTNFFFPLD